MGKNFHNSLGGAPFYKKPVFLFFVTAISFAVFFSPFFYNQIKNIPEDIKSAFMVRKLLKAKTPLEDDLINDAFGAWKEVEVFINEKYSDSLRIKFEIPVSSLVTIYKDGGENLTINYDKPDIGFNTDMLFEAYFLSDFEKILSEKSSRPDVLPSLSGFLWIEKVMVDKNKSLDDVLAEYDNYVKSRCTCVDCKFVPAKKNSLSANYTAQSSILEYTEPYCIEGSKLNQVSKGYFVEILDGTIFFFWISPSGENLPDSVLRRIVKSFYVEGVSDIEFVIADPPPTSSKDLVLYFVRMGALVIGIGALSYMVIISKRKQK